MHSLPNFDSTTLGQQYGARLLFRLVRGILIALATIASACLAGGMADGRPPETSPPFAAQEDPGAMHLQSRP